MRSNTSGGPTIALAFTTAAAVVIERAAVALGQLWRRRLEHRYVPLVERALAGYEVARRALVASPSRHRIILAELLIVPLIGDRDPERIAGTRTVVQLLSLIPLADRYLRSRWWWRRALALRALGLIQFKDRTAAIIAALDDSNWNVREAALDALTDLQDPASLQAVVVRLHDASLHRGRRLAN